MRVLAQARQKREAEERQRELEEVCPGGGVLWFPLNFPAEGYNPVGTKHSPARFGTVNRRSSYLRIVFALRGTCGFGGGRPDRVGLRVSPGNSDLR